MAFVRFQRCVPSLRRFTRGQQKMRVEKGERQREWMTVARTPILMARNKRSHGEFLCFVVVLLFVRSFFFFLFPLRLASAYAIRVAIVCKTFLSNKCTLLDPRDRGGINVPRRVVPSAQHRFDIPFRIRPKNSPKPTCVRIISAPNACPKPNVLPVVTGVARNPMLV